MYFIFAFLTLKDLHAHGKAEASHADKSWCVCAGTKLAVVFNWFIELWLFTCHNTSLAQDRAPRVWVDLQQVRAVLTCAVQTALEQVQPRTPPLHHCPAVLSPIWGLLQRMSTKKAPQTPWSHSPVSTGWLMNSQGQHTLSLSQFCSPWANAIPSLYSAELRLALCCFWHVFFPFCLFPIWFWTLLHLGHPQQHPWL